MIFVYIFGALLAVIIFGTVYIMKELRRVRDR